MTRFIVLFVYIFVHDLIYFCIDHNWWRSISAIWWRLITSKGSSLFLNMSVSKSSAPTGGERQHRKITWDCLKVTILMELKTSIGEGAFLWKKKTEITISDPCLCWEDKFSFLLRSSNLKWSLCWIGTRLEWAQGWPVTPTLS